MPLHLKRGQLPFAGASGQFEGFRHSPDIPLSIFFTTAGPGHWIKPHTHPYTEVFVILEGDATYTVAGETLAVEPGDVVVVLPHEVHEIRNSGSEPLRQLGSHCHGRFETTWLTGSSSTS